MKRFLGRRGVVGDRGWGTTLLLRCRPSGSCTIPQIRHTRFKQDPHNPPAHAFLGAAPLAPPRRLGATFTAPWNPCHHVVETYLTRPREEVGAGRPIVCEPRPRGLRNLVEGGNPHRTLHLPPPEVHHKGRARLAGGIHRGFPLPTLLPAALVQGECDKAISLKGVMRGCWDRGGDGV